MIKISDKVKYALENNIPIIALESTIISHGMPYPQNKETALHAMKMIEKSQCVPACIAIIKGVITVGLTEEEIDYIAYNKALKTSTRDIPYIVSQRLDGATTVSSTSFIASSVGIKVFATGGIGGVSIGNSSDVSSDLEELAETNICVVCAGIKSILDLEKTLEYLETKRVEVIGYKTEKLPAFYCESSNNFVNHTLNSPEEIALLLKTKWQLNLKGGVVVCNPIPKEFSLDEEYINDAINSAIEDMHRLKITGNKTTPYLLNRIAQITNNSSLDANIQLFYNNIKLAIKISKSLSV